MRPAIHAAEEALHGRLTLVSGVRTPTTAPGHSICWPGSLTANSFLMERVDHGRQILQPALGQWNVNSQT
jgi:hypothetical protein